MTSDDQATAERILRFVLGEVTPDARRRLAEYVGTLPRTPARDVRTTARLLDAAASLTRGQRDGGRERAPIEPMAGAGVRGRLLRRPMHLARTLAHVAHYSDPDTWRSLDYEPPPARPPSPATAPSLVPYVPRGDIEADVCVIGAGAAGCIVAHHLAMAGRSVVLVEEGPYRVTFDAAPDEMRVLGAVYRLGALQLSRDRRLSILQASGVGGSTMVNNGICTYPGDPDLSPARDNVLEGWRRAGFGLDLAALDLARQDVERRLSVRRLSPGPLGRNAALLLEPGAAHRSAADGRATVSGIFRTNLVDCLGCGLCNYGCAHGRRASVVDRYLVEAGRRRLRLVTGARVRRLEQRGGHTVAHVELADRGQGCRITASKTVLSCGAIASSALLLRSALGSNVGCRVSYNLSFPVLARFPETVHADAEVPMSAYVDHGTHILESVFFPPAAFAALLPEWGADHRESMAGYRQFAGAAVLTGSRPRGRVVLSGSGRNREPAVASGLGPVDRRRPREGMRQLAGHFLAQGASYVLFPALPWSGRATTMAEVERILRQLDDGGSVSLTTAHPQGGNAMHDDPRLGAADSSFRLHGSPSIYVCDASVFPSALGINPQLTVMAMADLCGRRLAGPTG